MLLLMRRFSLSDVGFFYAYFYHGGSYMDKWQVVYMP